MPPKKKTTSGYKFANPLALGTIIEDIAKKSWRIGPSIGKGGFGEIYSAQKANLKSKEYPYIVKIEPHSNGPLFVEINFLIRCAKVSSIDPYKKEKRLKHLGIPLYHGSGSYEDKEKCRFLVIDRFSTDLNKLFIENHKVIPEDTVFKIALQMVDALEYIHSEGYVHADIKAANILLGRVNQTEFLDCYLVDYGLATKYFTGKEFKPNPKKAHDGTIEYLSRDAHLGVHTRRGDMEILAYNLIEWLGCTLPWKNNLSDPKIVQQIKAENMSSISKILKNSFGNKLPPRALVRYLDYIDSLEFNTSPDYNIVREIFKIGVKEAGGTLGTVLKFSADNNDNIASGSELPKTRKNPQKKALETPTTISNATNKRRSPRLEAMNAVRSDQSGDSASSASSSSPTSSRKAEKKPERRKRILSRIAETTNSDDEVQHSPQMMMKNITMRKKRLSKSVENLQDLGPMQGFTDAMKEIYLKKQEKTIQRKRRK